jgi:hypothetical protein
MARKRSEGKSRGKRAKLTSSSLPSGSSGACGPISDNSCLFSRNSFSTHQGRLPTRKLRNLPRVVPKTAQYTLAAMAHDLHPARSSAMAPCCTRWQGVIRGRFTPGKRAARGRAGCQFMTTRGFGRTSYDNKGLWTDIDNAVAVIEGKTLMNKRGRSVFTRSVFGA